MRAAFRRYVLVTVALAAAGFATAAVSFGDTAPSPGPPFIAVGPVSNYLGRNANLCVPGSVCYTPSQLESAYDFPNLFGHRLLTGAGQTVVVVVAYGNPGLEQDVSQFDQLFHLGVPSLAYCGMPNGQGFDPTNPDEVSWAAETSADVEYVHAFAPDARIVVAVASGEDDQSLADVETQCLPSYPGAIVAQSFGDDENLIDPSTVGAFHAAFEAATAAGGTIVAAAGDYGATGYTPFEGGQPFAVATYPASDPLVTAVGGTMGDPYPGGLTRGNGGRYGAEQVWNESSTFGIATGGAPSALFDDPDYQAPFNGGSARTVADVAWNAAVNGGEVVVFGGQLGNYGGTSVGAPAWAAIFALADQARALTRQDPLGEANPALYAIAGNPQAYARDFHDITQGSNADNSDIGYSAGSGYDMPTGLGTPDVAHLILDLVLQRPERQGHGGPPHWGGPHTPGGPGDGGPHGGGSYGAGHMHPGN